MDIVSLQQKIWGYELTESCSRDRVVLSPAQAGSQATDHQILPGYPAHVCWLGWTDDLLQTSFTGICWSQSLPGGSAITACLIHSHSHYSTSHQSQGSRFPDGVHPWAQCMIWSFRFDYQFTCVSQTLGNFLYSVFEWKLDLKNVSLHFIQISINIVIRLYLDSLYDKYQIQLLICIFRYLLHLLYNSALSWLSSTCRRGMLKRYDW